LLQVDLTLEESIFCYRTIVIDMRRMYHECNLVHGDLSEYNLLWYRNRPVIIDVSQSVEHAHPFANDFLKKDVQNINEFFSKREVSTLSNYHLFQFITATKENLILTLDTSLKEMRAQAQEQSQREEGEGQGQGQGEQKEELMSLSEIVSQMLSQLPAQGTEPSTSATTSTPAAAPIIPSTLPISDEPLDAHLQTAHQLTDLPVSVLEYLLTRFLTYQEFQNEISATQSNNDTNESEIQEAVFLQSYIPSSLNEFSNPVNEKNKLEKGQREAAYTSAINQMLAAAPPPLLPHPSEEQEEEEGEDPAQGDNSDEEDESCGSSNGSGSGSDDSDSEDDEKRKKSGKYRRRLPGTDSNPEERKQIKDERKEAKRLAKEMAALKRTQKVPKHVKKRAVKNGKKK
jgi:RIO kinase 1